MAGNDTEDSNFFLTGVNVKTGDQDVTSYVVEDDQKIVDQVQTELTEEQILAQIIDKYKLVAVVDSTRSFSND